MLTSLKACQINQTPIDDSMSNVSFHVYILITKKTLLDYGVYIDINVDIFYASAKNWVAT